MGPASYHAQLSLHRAKGIPLEHTCTATILCSIRRNSTSYVNPHRFLAVNNRAFFIWDANNLENVFMKKKLQPLLLSCLFLLAPVFLFSQEKITGRKDSTEENIKGTHQIALFISHSKINEGKGTDGNNDWLIVPSWSLDYNYWLAERWALGVHSDMFVESFEVVDHEGTEETTTISRTRPIAIVPVVIFKPGLYGSFVAGVGGEFAKEGNFALTRLGYEYSWELPKRWELSAALTYDIKWNGYNVWSLGLGVAKSLGRKKRE